MSVRAIWNGTVLAESDDTVIVEGNHYFPRSDVHTEYFADSTTNTVCGWKGTASYYTVAVDGERNVDAAWYYPEPKDEARSVLDRIAFWKGVEVSEASD